MSRPCLAFIGALGEELMRMGGATGIPNKAADGEMFLATAIGPLQWPFKWYKVFGKGS